MRHLRRPILTSLLAGAAVTLLAAGCGSSSPTSPTSPSASGSTTSGSSVHLTLVQIQQDTVRFADCMRSHGVNFPDPTTDPHAFKNAFNTESPATQSAGAACQHLLPPGGTRSGPDVHSPSQIAAFVAFAHCMRGHGFPSFPDPTSTGQLSRQMLASAGIDLHQPAIVQAADACTSVTHGVITRAMVARFASGQ